MKRWLLSGLAAALLLSGGAAAHAQDTFQNLTTSQQTSLTQARAQALTAVLNALNYLRAIGPAAVTGNSQVYNRAFGQFYDTSAANPLRGTYEGIRTATYGSAEQLPWFRGAGTPTNFTGASVLQDRWAFSSLTGQLSDPPEFLFAHSPGNLYGFVSDIYAVGTIQTTRLTFTPPTNLNINTNFQRAAYTLTGGTWFPANSGPPIGIYDYHVVNKNRIGNIVDSSRYNDLVNMLTDVRDALAFQNFTFEGDLEANRGTITGILGTSIGTVTRGFGEYGFSTTGSLLKQDRVTAMLADPTLGPLEWWEDTGRRDILGNLLPGEINNFFENKFGVLFDGTTGTFYVGKSALDGREQVNDSLYDTSNNDGQFQNSRPLWQQLIGAILAGGSTTGGGLTQGGREALFGINEINRANGSPNVDTVTGFGDIFPNDRDVGGILNFVSNNASQSATSPPPGKVLNAAPSLGQFLLSDGIVVPF